MGEAVGWICVIGDGEAEVCFASQNTNARLGTTDKPVLPRGRTFPAAHRLPYPQGTPIRHRRNAMARNGNVVSYMGGMVYIRIIRILGILELPPQKTPQFSKGRNGVKRGAMKTRATRSEGEPELTDVYVTTCHIRTTSKIA